MFSSHHAEHSLNLPCRRISSLTGDTSQHQFLVGTCFLPGTYDNQHNEIHLLRFNEELNEIMTEAVLNHPTGEVWTLAPCPSKSDLVLTCGGKGETVLWKFGIPEKEEGFYEDSSPVDMEAMMRLPEEEERVVSAIWDPSDDSNLRLAALTKDTLSLWDFQSSPPQQLSAMDEISSATSLSWDPHNTNNLACSHTHNISIFDIRSPTTAQTLPRLHRYPLTDVDYNPNKPNIILTASHDALLQFHDLRNPSTPLKICRGGHCHWVTRARYNPFHDQLMVSAGTDSVVNLWRISSISSAPLLELEEAAAGDEEEEEFSGPDIRVQKFEGQDSVYDVAWSSCDAWCFCSVGFDGCVALHHVPSKEKYKILL